MIICPFQPTLFPSLYVFNRAHQSDLFVTMLSAQFCAANRKEDGNKGKTGQRHMKLGGLKPVDWVSIPIVKELQPLRSTELKPSQEWRDRTMDELASRYSTTPYWDRYRSAISKLLQESETLGELNTSIFKWGHTLFELSCDIVDDVDLCEPTKGNDWVFSMVQASGADTLITGAPSLNYLDQQRYAESGLKVQVQNWTCPEYDQISDGWTPNLSMLDPLFHIGAEATSILVKTPEL